MPVGRELLTTYSTGVVSVVHGSKTVRGAGVYWMDVQSADTLVLAGQQVTIASVTDTTHLELAAPWCGETLDGAPYIIRFDAPSRWPGYIATRPAIAGTI